MRLQRVFVVVLSLVIASFPVAVSGGSLAAGQMLTRGSAEINGIAAPAVTSVFAGDRVATEKGSMTELQLPAGDRVVLEESTRVALSEKSGSLVVNLESGTVSVSNKAKTRILVTAHGALIQAKPDGPAIFDVTLHGNALRVVSGAGAAHVETANREGDVAAGNALDATFASSDPPNGGAGGGSGSSAYSSTGTWITIGLGAMSAAALGIGTYDLVNSSSSPSSPSK